MMALSPQVSIQTYPSSKGEPVAETFVYAYARLKWRLAVEGNHISVYWLDTGEKLLIPDELAEALVASPSQLEAERQRRAELEAELARYRERYGDLGEDSGRRQ